ncbi:hypothetical protein AM493_09160 [Flavobacterium akiainvivens]|uniref:Uncharacterized protein n=1 Tax=Flavobacterium akiainvivens TaxID=1202724 RepID=A0A0M8ME17_9FLAO|nr:hypothetical protein AM493_09160 [Flavobacterium akiainvivens]
MKIPTIHGIIERRMLINYAIDPVVAQSQLPASFRPLLHNGSAIGGICLIRLTGIKPKAMPFLPGIASENGAHRFAVEWDENGVTKQGVYIPRRDTSSRLNALAGGRIFPGKHYKANFKVTEQNGHYNVGFTSSDATTLSVKATETNTFNSPVFGSNLDMASAFFKNGCQGYTPGAGGFDGLTLHTYSWQVQPLDVETLQSSYFDDETIFPKGSVTFDNALLMKNIEHEWRVGKKIS